MPSTHPFQHPHHPFNHRPFGRRRVPLKGSAAALRAALREGFDCLLVAMPSVDARQLLTRVLPMMCPSACFAVYSQWLQPLAEALQPLHARKQAVCLQLHEGWMRPYQVGCRFIYICITFMHGVYAHITQMYWRQTCLAVQERMCFTIVRALTAGAAAAYTPNDDHGWHWRVFDDWCGTGEAGS